MPEVISLEEENIYVFKVERPIENFSVEGVRKRLEANSPIVLSLLESDNKLFIVISYESATGTITHWQTWLDVELFMESQEPLIVYQKHLIVHIDEGKNIYRCCGPVRTDLLSREMDAFVLLGGEKESVEMSRTAAESAILKEGKKKIIRKGSKGTTVISLKSRDGVEHVELTNLQEIQAKHAPAFIIYGSRFELLEVGKWSNLERMRSNEVLPLVELCKYRVRSLWQTGHISNVRIENLPNSAFDELKANVLLEKNLQVHFNFFRSWLEQHIDYTNYGSDSLTGAFNLKGQARATGTPDHVYKFEINWNFQKFNVFRLDIYDMNKVKIVVLCKILERSYIPYRVSTCVADLSVVKQLLLCCYVAEYLEKQLKKLINSLKNTDFTKELTVLKEDLNQLGSDIDVDTDVVEDLVKNKNDYINIYPSEKGVFFWVGEARVSLLNIMNIILFAQDKKLLKEKNLELLFSQAEFQFLEKLEESAIVVQPVI